MVTPIQYLQQIQDNSFDTDIIGGGSSYIQSDDDTYTDTDTSDDSSKITTNSGDGSGYIPPGNNADPLGQSGNIEDEMNDIFNNLTENSFQVPGADGFWTLDEAGVEKLFRTIQGLTNLRMALIQILESRIDTNDNTWKIIFDMEDTNDDSKKKIIESTAKSNQFMISQVLKGISIAVKEIQEYNNEIYKQKVEAAKQQTEGAGNKVANWFSSGGQEVKQVEMLKAAAEQYKAAMQKTVDALRNSIGFQGLTNDLDSVGRRIYGKLSNVDNYLEYDSNGYVKEGSMTNFLLDLRRAFAGLENANKAIVSTYASKESTTKTMWSAVIGKNLNDEDKMKAGVNAVEQEAQYETMVFDRLLQSTNAAEKLKNQAKYYQVQLDKMDTGWRILNALAHIGTVVVVAIAIVGYAFSITGIGLAIGALATAALAAISAWGASEKQNSTDGLPDAEIDNDTKPLPQATKKQKNHSTAIDWTSSLEKEQNRVFASVGYNQIHMTADGIYEADSGKLADLTQRLGAINAAILAIVRTVEHRGQITRSSFSNSTGMRSSNSSSSISTEVEILLSGITGKFSALRSNLENYKTIKNDYIQREKALRGATRTLFISLGAAAASSVVGGIGGALAKGVGATAGVIGGWSIGYALGSAFAGLYNARWDKNSSFGVTYDPKTNFKGKASSKDVTIDWAKASAYSDAIENSMYMTILDENSITDAGGGYVGVDENMVQGQMRAARALTNLKAALLAIVESKARAANAAFSNLGVAVTDDGARANGLALKKQTEFIMQTTEDLISLQKEKAEVMNRANEAEKAVTEAAVKLGVNAAIAVAGVSATFITKIGSLFSITSGVMGVADAAMSMGFAASKMNEGYGNFQIYVDQKESKGPDKSSPKSSKVKQDNEDKLNKLINTLDEWENNTNVSGNIIEDVGGGSWGMNTGSVSKMQLWLETINGVRDAIMSIINQRAETASEGKVSLSNTLSTAISLGAEPSTKILQAQADALQTVMSRHDKINDAARTFFISTVQGIMATISLAISIKQATKQSTQQQLLENDKQNSKGDPNKLPEAKIKEYKNLQIDIDTLGIANFIVGLSSTFAEALTGIIYDESHATNYKSADEIKANKKADDAKEARKKQSEKDDEKTKEAKQALSTNGSADSSSGILNLGDTMDTNIDNTTTSQLTTGAYDQQIRTLEFRSKQQDEIFGAIHSEGKQVIDGLRSMKEASQNKKREAMVVKFNTDKEATQLELHKTELAMGVASHAFQAYQASSARYNEMLDLKEKKPSNVPDVKLLEAQADLLEKAVEYKTALQSAHIELTALQESAQKTNESSSKLSQKESEFKPEGEELATNKDIEAAIKTVDKNISALQVQNNANVLVPQSDIAKLTTSVESADRAISRSYSVAFAESEIIKDQDILLQQKVLTDSVKKIEELKTRKDVYDYYVSSRKEQFVPAQKSLQASISAVNTLRKRVAGGNLSLEEIASFEKALETLETTGAVTAVQKQGFARKNNKLKDQEKLTKDEEQEIYSIIEGLKGVSARARSSIQSFNLSLGKIREAYKSKQKMAGFESDELPSPPETEETPKGAAVIGPKAHQVQAPQAPQAANRGQAALDQAFAELRDYSRKLKSQTALIESTLEDASHVA